jgi:dTDP-4-dehydrorhamnose reductase
MNLLHHNSSSDSPESKPRLLVTGASGLLGLNLAVQLKDAYHVIGVYNKKQLQQVPFDLIQGDFFIEGTAERMIAEARPDAIIHCAAMANIDACEKNPLMARQINGEIPGEIASLARKHKIRLIHISTDAVFDGLDCGEEGYHEEDQTNPINVYAQTKLLGEQNVLDQNPEALVARVNFYGWSVTQSRSLGEIFFHNLAEKKTMMGFTDVFFCTLYVQNMVRILDQLIQMDASGLYHVFSSDFQSKYDFGVSIARRFGLDASLISPVSWKESGLTAKRSPNLIMNTDKLHRLLGENLPTQKDCLEDFYRAYQDGLPELLKQIGLQ